MSKYRLDSPANTPLDPFAFEKQFAQPNLNNPSPFSGVAGSLEVVAPDKVDEGYGTMGNSGYAIQAINEAKAANQGTLELTAKGLANVAKTIGIETAKVPGYLGGVAGALGNEIIGDGKDSMSYIVDNAWINAFEKLDQAAKDAMPVYMSKQVQEGGLLDKLGSGAWWAEAGADGLGFMLSMFVPGAIAKAAGAGAKIAGIGKALGNLSPRLGKLGTAAGLLKDAGEGAYAFTKTFARNADGVASAILNTTIESSAEAANTFDTLKTKYINEGLTEEEAKAKAGEGAAAVFKGNLALLAVSNLLDEAFIWKTLGSAGEKEAGKSVLSRIFKDGNIDFDELAKLPKEFTTANMLKRTGINFGKGILKEGFFEEGAQTTLQQNVEKGKISKEGNFLEKVGGDLLNVATSYLDDFSNNTELHEAIFLGGLLGGGASIFGTYQENNALRKAINGGEARTKDNFWVKYGILPETNAQKGLSKIIAENHIAQFRTYKDLLDEQDDGSFRLNEQKLADANIQQADILKTNILYDLAVAQGNKLGQEIYGQFLAANYVNGFLGQEGGQELFKDHVEKQVLPAWQKRYLETYGVDATDKQSREYKDRFYNSGARIFEAHKSAQETDYSERYYSEPTKEYQDFKHEYFHNKFQTLVALDSYKERSKAIQTELLNAGLTDLDLEDLSSIKDETLKVKAQKLKEDLKELNESQEDLNSKYATFFTKEGVKKMYEDFKSRKENFEELKTKVEELNQKLKEQVDQLLAKNQAELERLQTLSNGDKAVNFRSSNGKRYSIEDLENFKGDITNLQLNYDDVSNEEWDKFIEDGSVTDKTVNSIVEKIKAGEPLSKREQAVADGKNEKIEELLKEAKDKEVLEEAKNNGEIILSNSEEDVSDEVDTEIDELNKKKGVNLYPSTGRNLKSTLVELKPGVFVEEMTDSPAQKLWFETLDKEVNKNPTAYTVQIVRYGDRNSVSPELKAQIEREAAPGSPKDSDTYLVLHKDGKPIIKGNSNVFTSLWRPDNLYPVKDGKPTKFILAEAAILENYLLSVGRPKMKIDRLSKTDKDLLKINGVEPNEQSIMTAAFFHAKKEYQEWYSSLTTNDHLQMSGVTKGHRAKAFSDPKGKNPIWGNPIKGLGIQITDKQLVGAKVMLSKTGTIKIEGEEYKIASGDVVLIDSENNVHPLKARNLNSKEVETVLYLLSLRDTTGPTEAIMIKSDKDILFGKDSFDKIPVFYNQANPKMNLISSLINFGSNEGRKGEIYFNAASLATKPLLVFTDFNGETQNIEVSMITEAFKTNDFSKIDSLVKFLEQKRVNVNEHLLGDGKTANKFSKPEITYTVDTSGVRQPQLSFNDSDSYLNFMLNNVMSTTTQKFDGYPNRVQRNIFFHKQPISPTVVEDKVETIQSQPTAGVVEDNITDTLRGKPVVKDSSQKSVSDIEKERVDLISRESTAKEKFEFINSLPQGTVFTSDGDSRVVIGQKKILKSGTEEFELTTEIFNEDTNTWEVSDVTPISKKHTGEYSGKFPSPMLNNPKTDLISGERSITKPVITIPQIASTVGTVTQSTSSTVEDIERKRLEELKKPNSFPRQNSDKSIDQNIIDTYVKDENGYTTEDDINEGDVVIDNRGQVARIYKDEKGKFEIRSNLISDRGLNRTEMFNLLQSRKFRKAKVESTFDTYSELATLDKNKVEPIQPVKTAPVVTESKPALTAKERLAEKIKNKKSLDSFKDDMDKILTTTDLLKSKIQSGEIIQNCK